MSILVREFAFHLGDPGRRYAARVRGHQDETGMWHGWIELVPLDGGVPLQTDRETTQGSYEHLDYWASGLTSSYLEGALDRAHPITTETPTPPPPLRDLGYDPARIREPHPEATVVRIEVETLDPTVPLKLMAATELFEGRVRRIPGGGILVYDGVDAPPGKPARHGFLLQYGSTNAAAVVANHLWSDLHGEGAILRIEGERVALENHAINERLKSLLLAARS